jgi:plastocyanin
MEHFTAFNPLNGRLRMNPMLAVLFLLAGISAATAGTITGSVRAEGKTGTDTDAAGGAYASRKYKFVERVNYDDMHEFLVFIEGHFAMTNATTNVVQVSTRRVAQQGATFSPHILPVVAGTTVEWPNQDDIFHNVFSVSDAKQFDLGLYKGNPPEKRVTFDKPGRVDVYCSIHENMHCVVYVLENPFFAVTDQRGHFTITGVPPGTYKLKAWHERLPMAEQQITVPADGDVKADIVMGIKNLPQY